MQIFTYLLTVLVRLYQLTLSSFWPGVCRYQPSCSHYTMIALNDHGPFKGMWLAIKRILRCHPFGGSGFDPVPPIQKQSKI